MRVLLALALAWNAGAVTIGHVDDFQGGTLMGWMTGQPIPGTPLLETTGGPGGDGDAFMRLTATGGSGPGSRLAINNASAAWTGSYLGVAAIRMDLRNFGPADLYIRLLLEDFDGPGPPVNLATTDAVFLPAGGGWQSATFSIAPAALIPLIGSPSATLASVDVLRIFHNPDPVFLGPGNAIPTVNASLGVDNIEAVPEPSTCGLLGLGLGLLAWRARK